MGPSGNSNKLLKGISSHSVPVPGLLPLCTLSSLVFVSLLKQFAPKVSLSSVSRYLAGKSGFLSLLYLLLQLPLTQNEATPAFRLACTLNTI